jgi:leader peptidase (prepilin peptidase)/N-methyltransferase
MIACLFFALFGLAIGSFLNVCIVRLPIGESVVRPASHCRRCGAPVAARDNIPVLSWLLLRGKCRACGTTIHWQYPAVESATCVLFVMCCLQFPLGLAVAWALLCFLLLGLAVMDSQTLLLPDAFTLPGLLAGLAFSVLRPGLELGDWSGGAAIHAAGLGLVAASAAAAVLLLIAGVYWLARRRMGMGMGDVKLLAMLGAWLGLEQAGLVLFLGVVAGALYGLGLLLMGRGRNREPAGQLMVPFGTMLSLAGIYSVFLGERTLHWYLQFFR